MDGRATGERVWVAEVLNATPRLRAFTARVHLTSSAWRWGSYFRRTWSVTALACVSAPAEPEIERVYVPVLVVDVVRTVSVDVDAVGLGEKPADAPPGRPLTVSETAAAKPPDGVTDTP